MGRIVLLYNTVGVGTRCLSVKVERMEWRNSCGMQESGQLLGSPHRQEQLLPFCSSSASYGGVQGQCNSLQNVPMASASGWVWVTWVTLDPGKA